MRAFKKPHILRLKLPKYIKVIGTSVSTVKGRFTKEIIENLSHIASITVDEYYVVDYHLILQNLHVPIVTLTITNPNRTKNSHIEKH